MQIIPFNYKSITVRVIQDESRDPWWVAKDICKILGLEDTHKAVQRLDKDEIHGMSELDLIIRSAQALKNIETRVHTLEAKTHMNSGQTGYWTITAWCKLNKLNISLDEAMLRGREAAKLSKEWSAQIGRVHDERFGLVNSYREDVLEEVFFLAEEPK